MRLSEYKAGTILVDGDGKVFIHDGFVNADGYGVIIGESSYGMIMKSNGIGNWMKWHIKGVATKEQISEFIAKVRKTQEIINYQGGQIMSNIYKEDFVDEDTGEVVEMEIDLDKLHKHHKEDKQ